MNAFVGILPSLWYPATYHVAEGHGQWHALTRKFKMQKKILMAASRKFAHAKISSYTLFPFLYTGPLAAPGSLTVTNRIGPIPQPVVLRWDAPFSLDITGVEPDISNYIVFIVNLNTNKSNSVILTSTEYEFTNLPGETPNPCYIHSFTVTAINMAGEGNSSEPVLRSIREGMYIHVDEFNTSDIPVSHCQPCINSGLVECFREKCQLP